MLKKTWLASVIGMAAFFAAPAQKINQLSDAEKQEGWLLLFDGKTSSGWHTYNKKTFGPAWLIDDGSLYSNDSHRPKTDEELDICTNAVYQNFDLKYQWKISKNGNSGVMFLVQESPAYSSPYETGPEMQVLDNEGHPDGKIHKHRAGDLYDLIASSSEPVHPVGEWNDAEIKLDHGRLTLYLNNVQIVSTWVWDENWHKLVQGSKFRDMPGFAKYESGHIDLQDHQCDVWFRNIKIKIL